MKRFRGTCAVLICAALALTACSGEDADTTAGPTPTTSATSSAAASAAPTASTAAAGAVAPGDKKLCESVKKAGDEMRKDFIAAMQSGGGPSPALLKKVLNQMNKKMTTLSAGSDSKVAGAMKKFGAQAAKSAKAADPATAASNSAFEKAGANLTAACKPTGVNVNF